MMYNKNGWDICLCNHKLITHFDDEWKNEKKIWIDFKMPSMSLTLTDAEGKVKRKATHKWKKDLFLSFRLFSFYFSLSKVNIHLYIPFQKAKYPKPDGLSTHFIGNVDVPPVYRVLFFEMSEKDKEKMLNHYWTDLKKGLFGGWE